MSTLSDKPMFILEMANNHMGDMDHGLRMIREFHDVVKDFDFKVAFKFQLRSIPEFIHPDFRDRMDIKYVNRFTHTALSRDDFERLLKEVKSLGFVSICTPFDEPAVETVVSMGFDIIKIASCSFTDWPLLERIVTHDKPILASTAGAELREVDNVVSFFQHRNKDFAILHCVGEYPTIPSQLQLNQIDMLQKRYPDVPIGYSTHEEPENMESVKIAVSKGAMLFEKHVAVETEAYPKNAYSATPEQVRSWLEAARSAFDMCGVDSGRHVFSAKEQADLRQFKRGVFVNRPIKAGERITSADCFFAWPTEPGQVLANEFSKYVEFTSKVDLKEGGALFHKEQETKNYREKIYQIVSDVNDLVKRSGIPVPGKAELEISHHYGIDRFYEYGITMVTVVNRDYCKKYIIVLPGQNHPEQFHHKKEETFVIQYGEFDVQLDGVDHQYGPGDVITVRPEVRHAFSTKTGGIIEEISTTHFVDDSYYTDTAINENPQRKTFLSHWIM